MKAPVDEAPLHRLLGSLPAPVARGFHALRQPGRRWVRIPLGVLCIGGGFLWFLPVLGLWMLPVGVILLAEDVPGVKRPAIRGLGAVQAWWDRRRGRALPSRPHGKHGYPGANGIGCDDKDCTG